MTLVPEPDRRQLTDQVFHWARRSPHKTAMVYNGRPMSYRRFAAQIAAARGFFVRRGWGGSGVAILAIQNLQEFWIISLALRSLGLTTIVPSSAKFLAELALPDARCVVTTPTETWPHLAETCRAKALPLVTVALGDEGALGPGETAPPGAFGGHILLSSGTTASPKMVLMDPSFEPEFFQPRLNVSRVTRTSIISLFNLGAFTGGGYKWCASAFTCGATVVVDQREEQYKGLLYPGTTHALIVPGMLQGILSAPEGTLAPRKDMRLQVGGGTLSQRQIDQIRTHITPHLYSSFGATETRSIACTAMTSPEDYQWHQLSPHLEVQIVDEFDRPVALGQTGRLRVSTANAPTSYLYDDEATRTFFRDGFFYTGDLAVQRQDGRMALQGRFTDIINIGGRKMSPEPLEHRLRDSLGVDAVFLFSTRDDAGHEEMHAAIEIPDLDRFVALEGALRRELAIFPRVTIHHTPALPRNDMGKLLRQAARDQVLLRSSRPG